MSIAILAAALAASSHILACETRLERYAGWKEPAGVAWTLDLATDGLGTLSYFGADHSRDPADPQFSRIHAAFETARPTVVFYEGPDRGIAETGETSIKSRGESGYVRWLADKASVRAVTLEPTPGEQMRAIADQFGADKAMLFFVGREAARLRDREALQGETLNAAVSNLLSRMAPLAKAARLSIPFDDLQGLDATWARYWPNGPNWRESPSDWYDPLADDAATGGRFMAAINAASSEDRNRHIYRLLAEAAGSGERVFAVVGRNHVPMQAAALQCALNAAATAR